jgi:hypothetical protein
MLRWACEALTGFFFGVGAYWCLTRYIRSESWLHCLLSLNLYITMGIPIFEVKTMASTNIILSTGHKLSLAQGSSLYYHDASIRQLSAAKRL